MMSAAAMGAAAFQKGLGAIHSLSHPIGALYDTHHGMTNACSCPMASLQTRRHEVRIARLAPIAASGRLRRFRQGGHPSCARS